MVMVSAEQAAQCLMTSPVLPRTFPLLGAQAKARRPTAPLLWLRSLQAPVHEAESYSSQHSHTRHAGMRSVTYKSQAHTCDDGLWAAVGFNCATMQAASVRSCMQLNGGGSHSTTQLRATAFIYTPAQCCRVALRLAGVRYQHHPDGRSQTDCLERANMENWAARD